MRRLVGRDVLGAPRAGGRPCAHGDVHAARTGTFRGRGPPRTSAPTTNAPWPPCARAAPAGGRDAPAGRARRPRRAARMGTRTLRAWGRPGGRGPPGTSAPTTNAPWPPCARAAPTGGRDAPAGRARRPRRAARRGRARCAHGDAPGDAGRRGRRPLPQMSPWPPCARAAPAGGLDAPAGRARRPRRAARMGTSMPRAWGRPCRAHGDVPGTRAAGDVGPYHKRPVAAMRPCRPDGGTGCAGW